MNWSPLKQRATMLALAPLLSAGIIYTSARYLWASLFAPRRALNIAYMIDQTANVDINGKIDETISARAAIARNAGKRWGCILCAMLDKIQTGHCDKALADDTHNPSPNA